MVKGYTGNFFLQTTSDQARPPRNPCLNRKGRCKRTPHMPPNILFFQVDQLSAASLSTYGGVAITPNLDRLAASGAVFETAYCNYPLCAPSRASMATGQLCSAIRAPAPARRPHRDRREPRRRRTDARRPRPARRRLRVPGRRAVAAHDR
ncbi:MAG: sulfatase-like hydrolase/transferase, partial [Pseudomonadota bacterium]